jgi:DNA-binding NtrC family response regulator
LEAYSFPGNVRELKLVLFDAVSTEKSNIMSADAIRNKLSHAGTTLSHLKPTAMAVDDLTKDKLTRRSSLPTLKEAEEMLVEEALKRSGGNQTTAAQMIGLTRSALNKRLIRSRSSEADFNADT